MSRVMGVMGMCLVSGAGSSAGKHCVFVMDITVLADVHES